MTLIKSKRYPEYDTYFGDIYHTFIKFKTPRIPGLDNLASRIIDESVERKIIENGGHLLETGVSSENSWYGIIPTYTITIEIKWYIPGGTFGEGSLIAPVVAIVVVAIIAVVVLILGIIWEKKYWNFKEAHPESKGPLESIFTSLTLLIVVGVGAYLLIKFGPKLYNKIYKQKKT